MLKLEDNKKENNKKIEKETEKSTIELNNFCAYRQHSVSENDEPILKNLTINFKEGELWAIIGRVGSGKSKLLNSLLGQIPSYNGIMLING